jgi:hypothetical protein
MLIGSKLCVVEGDRWVERDRIEGIGQREEKGINR